MKIRIRERAIGNRCPEYTCAGAMCPLGRPRSRVIPPGRPAGRPTCRPLRECLSRCNPTHLIRRPQPHLGNPAHLIRRPQPHLVDSSRPSAGDSVRTHRRSAVGVCDRSPRASWIEDYKLLIGNAVS